MKRKIIHIVESLCNGCGECVTGCSEGALQIINGKAKLVREDFCDGFGDCIGHCPTGALIIREKDVKEFDEVAVKEHLLKTEGESAVVRMEEAQKKHQQAHVHAHGGGCPGSQQRVLRPQETKTPVTPQNQSQLPPSVMRSELNQWPVQLHLVNPKAEFFRNKEMVVLSTCSPIASADVHWRYMKGRSVVVACPKLDRTEPYVEKLAAIFSNSTIPKVTVLIMEVPCCHGLAQMAEAALKLSGRTDLILEIHILSLEGELKGIKSFSV